MKNTNNIIMAIKKISPLNVLSKPTTGLYALLAGAVLLTGMTGCQSTAVSQSNASPTSLTPSAAKTALATALQQQRRQSYSYHSNIEINNAQQFTTVDSTKLVASSWIDDYCADTHDQAYAALLEQAEADKKDILASEFDSKRAVLKQSYLTCDQNYQNWDANQPTSDDEYDYDDDDEYPASDYESDNSEDDSDNATTTSVAVTQNSSDDINKQTVVIVESKTIKKDGNIISVSSSASDKSTTVVGTAPVTPYYQKLFDEYDSKYTALDIRKAQLVDAYLYKPLSMNVQGVYQPLAGKFTMLGSVQYKARNHYSSINQPIYVDFKTGSIYLWADNFAMINSELADDKLGTKWQNKWLKLTLDDGTLPKGFGRAMIDSIFEAYDKVYDTAPISQFDYIAPGTLATLSPKLPQHQLDTMLNSKQAIRRLHSYDSYEQDSRDYISVFYSSIASKYPELILDKTVSEVIVDPSQSDETGDNKVESEAEAEKLTSKVMMQYTLALLKKSIDAHADSLINDVLNSEEEVASKPNAGSVIQELYGFDQNGKLQWYHMRDKELSSESLNDNITVDMLQQYAPIRAQDMDFPNLPANMQVPNASNSIDLREYASELAKYYRDGNGTAIGKMIFSAFPTYKGMFTAAMKEGDSNDAEELDAVEDADVDSDDAEETEIPE